MAKKLPSVNPVKPTQLNLFKKIPKNDPQLWFAPRCLVSCSLPYIQPKKIDGSIQTLWTRTNGKITTELQAHPGFGLPYGAARLFFIWLKTQSTKLRSPIVPYHSADQILTDLQIHPEGDNVRILKQQIRTAASTVLYTTDHSVENGTRQGALIIKKLNSWADPASYDPNHENYFQLGETFYKSASIPIDINTILQIRREYQLIDLYLMLMHRVYKKTKHAKAEDDLKKWKPLRFTLSSYRDQAGFSDNRPEKKVRADVKNLLKRISEISSLKPEFELDKITGKHRDVIKVPLIRPGRLYSPQMLIYLNEFYKQLDKNS